jgi:hypothetical protein
MTTHFDPLPSKLACTDVLSERRTQHAKWGVQRHSWPEWISILTEEVGEAAERANQAHWPPPRMTDQVRTIALDELRLELIQVAAVAVAILEHIEEVRTTGTR